MLDNQSIEDRAKTGVCGICGNNVFVIERGYRRCALCDTENLVGYRCPGCRSTSGVGDKMAGCAFCGQPLIESTKPYTCPTCGQEPSYHVPQECPFCGTI